MKRRVETSRTNAYVVAALASIVTVAIIAMPEVSFAASLEGLRVWWEVVFPALLPFFILSDALMALGVVHYIGALLEPLMRPLFGVPGVGAFAFAMGLASGYPIGARITARLRREGMCSQIEAERLVSFTNTADPLFMVGAVAVGMFRMPSLGGILASAHYISAVILGMALKWYGRPDGNNRRGERYRSEEPLLSRAAHELYTARRQDGRSVGQVFGDSVRDSVNTLLLIGGCIMVFSVIVQVLGVIQVTELLSVPLRWILVPLGMSKQLLPSIISGVFEITIGTEVASRAAAPLVQKAVVSSAIIAWSGLSVLAQVASMVHGTDIRLKPYCMARLAHAFLAGSCALVLIRLFPSSVAAASFAETALLGRPGLLWGFARSIASAAVAFGLLGLTAAAVASARLPRTAVFRVRKRAR